MQWEYYGDDPTGMACALSPLVGAKAARCAASGIALYAVWKTARARAARSTQRTRSDRNWRRRSARPSCWTTGPAPTVSSAQISLPRRRPAGYTLGTVIVVHSINASLYPKLPYDVLKDFTYVTLMSVAPVILVLHPAVPANSVRALIALAKKNPGQLNFAVSGTGAGAHLIMELFKSRSGISMTHIPYKGTAGALQDTIGGQINLFFDVVGPLMPHVRA